MSALSPSSAATPHPQRPPPPSLFLGPPSRNASNISLPPAAPAPSQPRAPLLRSRSARAPDPASATLGRARPQPPQPSQTEGDRTDALWAEMQATLAEVELSAFSSTHVFGSAHSAALDELREAQIALAKVWGRGEAKEEEEEEEAETVKVKSGQRKEDGKLDGKTDGESEEEEDIAEARRRREANEKFFSRVGKGVVDVVGKLEGVAQAMAKVERESREIWGGSDSVESSSVAT
ncbi:hypothetical protein HO173_011450 [Letharia columbiana]|uniref:Uncharacterized protein n=1 Tax=Letharia columbiana TaxID=112416 RepID=A0A8H6FJD4_9LECA|nr:uncharacterized protein HO173_011450 [Letharia columbiana]KAF6229595.1 hypothetical protein HO173_011450 [Letharia columbiana]